ncbi:MAG: hypothetical protein EPGJADBJ_02399 [Saprospiraceae bacterium]|nr:hypothetical protein [Saprospiraceae bacterium]
MKKSIIGLFLIVISTQCSFAQNSDIGREVIELSKKKWQWMADKQVDTLAHLFHDKSKFVHMSGTWNKDREIKSSKPEVYGTIGETRH